MAAQGAQSGFLNPVTHYLNLAAMGNRLLLSPGITGRNGRKRSGRGHGTGIMAMPMKL